MQHKNSINVSALLVQLVCMGQAVSKAVPTPFKSKLTNAYIIDLPQTHEFVEELFNLDFGLTQFGAPQIVTDGFKMFTQIKLPDLATNSIDFYFSLNESTVDKQNIIRVTVMISKGYDNFVTEQSDAFITQNILETLNDMGVKVAQKNVETEITNDEIKLLEQQKKLALGTADLQLLENQKKDMQDKINRKNAELLYQTKANEQLSNHIKNLRDGLRSLDKKITKKKAKQSIVDRI